MQPTHTHSHATQTNPNKLHTHSDTLTCKHTQTHAQRAIPNLYISQKPNYQGTFCGCLKCHPDNRILGRLPIKVPGWKYVITNMPALLYPITKKEVSLNEDRMCVTDSYCVGIDQSQWFRSRNFSRLTWVGHRPPTPTLNLE